MFRRDVSTPVLLVGVLSSAFAGWTIGCVALTRPSPEAPPAPRALPVASAEPAPPQRPIALLVRGEAGQASSPLRVSALEASVRIACGVATTKLDLTFKNDEGRVLEGELVLPLPPGAAVSSFALDVNGRLREASVVEREKARVAFEEVVRRGVDPGLVEWTKGDAFRTRVYPIPAHGTKRVVLGYEQELEPSAKGVASYLLPLGFGEALDSFELDVEQRENGKETRKSSLSSKNVKPDDLRLDIETPLAPEVAVERGKPGEAGLAFLARVPVPELAGTLARPKRLTILADASSPAARRDVGKERAFLEHLFETLGEASVRLVVFSDEVWEGELRFEVKEGKGEALLSRLASIRQDGGLRLSCLDLTKWEGETDHFLLLSDGISTVGKGEPVLSTKPIACLSSTARRDDAALRRIARAGAVVDLLACEPGEAVRRILETPLVLEGIETESGRVASVFPLTPCRVLGSTLSLAGRLPEDGPARLNLRFARGEARVSRQLAIDPREVTSDGRFARAWARKKVAALLENPAANEGEIVTTAKAHGLVTPFTSLLVLETLADYVKYRVPPPAEMEKAWIAQVAVEDSRKRAGREERLASLRGRLGLPEVVGPKPASAGSYTPVDVTTGVLIARQTAAKHAKIVALLAALRRGTSGKLDADKLKEIVDTKLDDGTLAGNEPETLASYDVADLLAAIPDLPAPDLGLPQQASGAAPPEAARRFGPVVGGIPYFGSDLLGGRIQNVLDGGDSYMSGARLDASGARYRELKERYTYSTQLSAKEIDALRLKVLAEQDFVAAKQVEVVDLKRELDRQNAELLNARRDLDRLRAQFETTNKSLEAERVRELQESLDTAQRRREIAEGQVARLTQLDTSLTKDLSDLRTSYAETRKLLKEREVVLAMLEEKGFDLPSILADRPMPAIEAKVAAVKTDVQPPLVLLSVGSDGKVEKGFVFTIHRDSDFVGRVVIEKVLKDSCGGRVIFTKEGETIRAGDAAATRPDMSPAPRSTADLYAAYLEAKAARGGDSAFYLDSADVLLARGERTLGLRALSNLASLEVESAPLLRLLAHRFKEANALDRAIAAFEEVARLRPEEPQSFRDLALAQADAGDLAGAIANLERVVLGTWDSRFPEIDLVARGELANLVARAAREGKRFHTLPDELVRQDELDLRVVLTWDADDCDMDLWVTEPSGEKAFYSHTKTAAGGTFGRDFRRGYGPEEYRIARAPAGKFRIQVDSYGDSRQTLRGPITVHVSVFENYGRASEKRRGFTRRLGAAKETVEIAEIEQGR